MARAPAPARPTASAAHPDLAARPCPICGKPSTPEAHPFCSPRCRQVDLHHWLTGSYAIPAVENDEDDEA